MIWITSLIGTCVLKVLAMSCENGIKVITTVEINGLPQGSVIQNCVEQKVDGEKYWSGLWCSMYGSFFELVKQEDCEIWNEEKHDPTMFLLKKYIDKKHSTQLEAEERATLKYLKDKYEKE